MKFSEVNKIYTAWQDYQEIHWKLVSLSAFLPESFLPYPKNVLEDVLNIVAKKYFEDGNHRLYKAVLKTKESLLYYREDAEALILLEKAINMVNSNTKLKTTVLECWGDGKKELECSQIK